MLLAKLAYSRRQFSPLRGSAYALSIRTYRPLRVRPQRGRWQTKSAYVRCTMYDLAKPGTQLCIIQHLSNYHLA